MVSFLVSCALSAYKWPCFFFININKWISIRKSARFCVVVVGLCIIHAWGVTIFADIDNSCNDYLLFRSLEMLKIELVGNKHNLCDFFMLCYAIGPYSIFDHKILTSKLKNVCKHRINIKWFIVYSINENHYMLCTILLSSFSILIRLMCCLFWLIFCIIICTYVHTYNILVRWCHFSMLEGVLPNLDALLYPYLSNCHRLDYYYLCGLNILNHTSNLFREVFTRKSHPYRLFFITLSTHWNWTA